jgi:hypothetical protein
VKAAFAVLTLAGIVALAFIWLYPASQDMRRKHVISEIILGADAARKEIVYRAGETKTLAGVGRGLTIAPHGAVTGGEVSGDGIIIVRGTVDDQPVEIGMKPALKQDGSLEWRCRGLKVMQGWSVSDQAHMPSACPKATPQNPF